MLGRPPQGSSAGLDGGSAPLSRGFTRSSPVSYFRGDFQGLCPFLQKPPSSHSDKSVQTSFYPPNNAEVIKLKLGWEGGGKYCLFVCFSSTLKSLQAPIPYAISYKPFTCFTQNFYIFSTSSFFMFVFQENMLAHGGTSLYIIKNGPGKYLRMFHFT